MNHDKKKIIFIYEGVKAEENLLNNLIKNFFSSTIDVSILNCPADGNIYMLWTRLKKDELCIINSVPLFLLEYYKEDFWDKVTKT